MPNLPLFVLAAPMIGILFVSSLREVQSGGVLLLQEKPLEGSRRIFRTMLALPQMLLATLAVSSFHVQIINRLSSGYPLIYVWIESCFHSNSHFRLLGRTYNTSRLIVSWMVMYALVQAGLFASFLPPA